MPAWPSRPVLTLVCVALLGITLSAQRPEHRDRLAAGLVPVVTTFPPGSSKLHPTDIEILEDRRVVIPAAVVTSERIALAILVDVAMGERARVGKLLEDVDAAFAGFPVEGTPIRHVNQFKLRVSGRASAVDFQTAPLSHASPSGQPGKWHSQSTLLWTAADWASAALQFRRGRRVIVVVTDGARRAALHPPHSDVGTDRQVSFSDFRTRVREQFATVFVVAIDNARLPSEWRDIAEESGGEVMAVGPAGDVRASVAELAGRIARQSVVYFTPTTVDGRTHRMQLRLKDGATLLPSPTLYVAPRVTPKVHR